MHAIRCGCTHQDVMTLPRHLIEPHVCCIQAVRVLQVAKKLVVMSVQAASHDDVQSRLLC